MSAAVAAEESRAVGAAAPEDPPWIGADRRVFLAVTALTVLAALLRLPFLGAQSLWFDETFTDHITAASSLGDLWTAIHDTESTPPLFYLLTAGWRHLIGSGSEAALRTVSGVAAVASVPLAFAATRLLAGRVAALGAAAVVAVSPVLTWYALDARAYALLVALSFVTVIAAARLADSPTPRRAAVWGVAVAGALWTHYFAVYLALGEALWLAAVLLPRREIKPLLLGGATAAVLTAPLLTLVLDQRDTRSAFIGERSLGGRISETARQLAMGPNVPNALLEAAGILLLAAGVLAGAAIALRRDWPWVAGLVAVPLGLPLVLAATGIDDHLFLRNLLIGLPGLAALAGLGLTHLGAVPLAAYGALATLTVLLIAGDWRYQKTDWERAAKLVPRSEPVVAVPALNAPVADHYLDATEGSGTVRAAGARTVPDPVVAVTVVLEPVRTTGRSLQPVTTIPQLPGFVPEGERTVEGFRVIHFTAPTPTPVDAAAIGGALVGPS